MRYLISKSNTDEWMSRKQYILDALHLWIVSKGDSNGFLEFISIPCNCLDIIFIVGHNNVVYRYIKNNITLIKERSIVAITCDGGMDFSSLKTFGKSLYICHQNTDNYAELFDGSQYDFGFNPTESELLFYNSKSIPDVNKRLRDSFTQLHEGENI